MMAFATSYRSLSSKCVHSISKRLLSSPSFPFSSLYRRTRTHSNLISPLAAVAFRSSPVRFTMNHPYNSPIGFGGDVGMSSDDSLKGGRGDQFTMDQSNNSQMKLSSGLMERYPKEMYNPGCDFEHWLVVMDTPGGPGATKEQIIDCYVQTLARVLGSEEEAKKKIYNVSCQGYYAFGCAIDEETCNKLEGLPGVLFTLPDSYIDVENKDYGAELYENGEIVERSPERQKRIQTLQWKGSQNGPKNNHRTIKQVKRSEHKEEA